MRSDSWFVLHLRRSGQALQERRKFLEVLHEGLLQKVERLRAELDAGKRMLFTLQVGLMRNVLKQEPLIGSRHLA